jgi:CheY-like chemotaxis protein
MGNLFVLDDDAVFHRLIEFSTNKHKPFKGVYHYYSAQALISYVWENRCDSSNLPDIILVDLNLPEFDGWQFLDTLQTISVSLCKAIQVYIVTVSVIKNDRQRANNYPIVKDFLVKPVSTKWLIAISELLEKV